MKHALFFVSFVVSFVTFAFPAVAQQKQATAPPATAPVDPINPIRQVPLIVRKQMPKTGKSCFYGSFKLMSGQKYFLHLFNPNPKQKSVLRDAETGCAIYQLMLHIFKPNGKKLRLVKTVALDYASLSAYWEPVFFGAQLLWLDPKHKSKPILKFDCFSRGEYGDSGDHVLAIFPNGFNGKAVIQSLAFGAWHASLESGQSTTFNGIDDKGLLELHTTLYGVGNVPPTEWTLRWNGKRFYPVNGPVKGVGSPYGAGTGPGLPYPYP